MLRRDGSFRIFEGVNAYKVNLQGKYLDSAIFKVSDIFLFNIDDDSMSNFFEEREHDTVQAMKLKNTLGVSIKSILKPKMKWIQEEFTGQSQETWI